MKAIMKKVAQLKGINLNTNDLLDSMDNMEFYIEQGCFVICNDNKLTVKVKGKVIDNKDVTFSFEEEG